MAGQLVLRRPQPEGAAAGLRRRLDGQGDRGLDRLSGGLDDGARLSGRVRAPRQRAVRVASAVRAVPGSVHALAASASVQLARISTCWCCSRSRSRWRSSTTRGSGSRSRSCIRSCCICWRACCCWRPAAAARANRCGLAVPVTWLAVAVVFLVGFRIGLNVVDSNVIDVGYAGVIGADKLVHGKPLYGHWPSDNAYGDTYGPVNYYAYVPFRLIFGWSGTWDDLPAAHGAAIAFDLLTLLGLFLLGRRIRGPTLGIALAYAWAVISVHAVHARVQQQRHAGRAADRRGAAGRHARRAGAEAQPRRWAPSTKFAPFALGPLFLRGTGSWPRRRSLALYVVGVCGDDRGLDAAGASGPQPAPVLARHRRLPGLARIAVLDLGAVGRAERRAASGAGPGGGARGGRHVRPPDARHGRGLLRSPRRS